MDSKQIGELVEKYWNCETSLEEEKQLRDFFQGPNVPVELQPTAELFRYLEIEKSKGLNENFDQHVTKKFQKRREGKVISLNFQNLSRIAAGILVVVAATFFIRQEIRKSYPKELQDTYSDPQMAFEETKKALMMISGSFGKAKKETEKMKMFNDAEKKIQAKQDSVKNI